MMPDELTFLSIVELAGRLRGRDVSPVEVTRATLEQIERLNPAYNAFLTVTADLALEQARQAESEIGRGQYRGPLHGAPISLKDLYLTRGIRTTGGSKILGDWVPDHDSAVGERLRQAGAVLVGKNHMQEFAFGTTNLNSHYGPARNPWDPSRVTGGSSGGSAVAVSLGMSYASLGSDTGGSIRMPAALCGVAGIKPTYGRVSRFGVLPLAWSADHTGPLARSVEDLAIVLGAIAGHDPRDPGSVDRPVDDYQAELRGEIRDLRIGLILEYLDDSVETETEAAVEAAARVLEGLGAQVEPFSFAEVTEYVGAQTTIIYAEAAAYHARWLAERPQDYTASVRERLQIGSLLPAIDYVNAQRARRLLIERANRVMERYDVLLSPTVPVPAPTIDESERPEVNNNLARFTRLFNMLGGPTASVPCGFTTSGLPIGLQIAGRAWEENTVLRLAHAYEQATPWHSRQPPPI